MASDEKRFNALGREWVARFDFNSICELEDRYDRPFLDLVAPFLGGLNVEDKDNPQALAAAASRIKFSDVRAIFHQSLLHHEPVVTAATAGDMIADMGLDRAMEVVAWAITKAMPTGGEGAATANPPKRAGRKG